MGNEAVWHSTFLIERPLNTLLIIPSVNHNVNPWIQQLHSLPTLPYLHPIPRLPTWTAIIAIPTSNLASFFLLLP